eukprot:TRINITY_DN11099_c0_g1_i10.p1 TRINITY_DN11099_c0_g1~~TRINITY_DN11099_c0_g1_i10.p1  ORF type:complete len:677 (+),score=185.97 TRINITY_DN11099_c0_g1_i10:73-2103(+)
MCIRDSNPDSVRFFRMMGLFPCGACSEVMSKIWGPGYKDHVDNLQYVSLLVRKESGELQGDRYWLLPFVADYATNYLQQYEIADVFERGCKYYADKLEATFMSDCRQNEVLIEDEPNIVAFLGSRSENKESEDVAEENSDVVQEDCEPVIENAGQELVPSREAVEMLYAEESRLNRIVKHGGQRLDRYNSEDSSELQSLKRADSEETHPKNLTALQLDRLRRISLFASREMHQSHFSSSNNSVDPDLSLNVGTDEELPPKKNTLNDTLSVRMTAFGQLLVYYCANLLLAKRHNDAKKMITNNVGLHKVAGDILAQANLYKMLGIISDKLSSQKTHKDYAESIKYYSKAKKLFFKAGSYLGQAACLVALGEIEKHKDEYEKAKWFYENALRNYTLIKHSNGIALSHCVLSLIKDKHEQRNAFKAPLLPVKLAREVQSNGNKKYIGGTFVSRWEGGPGAFIIEIARMKGTLRAIWLEVIMESKRAARERKVPPKLFKRQETMKTRLHKVQPSDDSEDSLSFRTKMEGSRRIIRKKSSHLMFSIEEEESKDIGEATTLKKKSIVKPKTKIDSTKKLNQDTAKKPIKALIKPKVASIVKSNVRNDMKQNKPRKDEGDEAKKGSRTYRGQKTKISCSSLANHTCLLYNFKGVGVLGFWLSLIHICRCRRIERCRSRWSPYH